MTEYFRRCCRHCAVNNKSSACNSFGPIQLRKFWCIAFCLGVSHIEDYIIGDYLLQCLIKAEDNNEWFWLIIDNKKQLKWVIPHVVKGDLQFTTRHPLFDMVNSRNTFSRTFGIDICSTFCLKIIFFKFKANFRAFLLYYCKLYWWYGQIPETFCFIMYFLIPDDLLRQKDIEILHATFLYFVIRYYLQYSRLKYPYKLENWSFCKNGQISFA